jgi:hypothetical protein
MAAFITKFTADPVGSVTRWAGNIKFMTAFVTKFCPFAVLKPTLWAFHFYDLHPTSFSLQHPPFRYCSFGKAPFEICILDFITGCPWVLFG